MASLSGMTVSRRKQQGRAERRRRENVDRPGSFELGPFSFPTCEASTTTRLVAVAFLDQNGDAEMEQVRAFLAPVVARNPNLKVHAKVPSNHSHILRQDFKTVTQVVRETAAFDPKAVPIR